MAERNKLSQIADQQMPERRSNFLSQAWDEATGAFARYGRRSGAQRDASLAMLSQAVDPNTDPLTGAGMKALGLAGLVTHPLAFFPTGDEWRERLANAGNTSRLGQSIGGMLGDLPSVVDPHLLAGGGALAMAPLAAKMMNKADDVADAGIKVYHSSPHNFDKFDSSKIGIGEGNQNYMHGLYSAESPKVSGRGGEYDAQFTARNLGKHDLTMQENAILRHMQPEASDMDVLDKILREGYVAKDSNGVPDFDQAEAAIRRIRDNKSTIYEARLDVSPNELIDWDTPMNAQPKGVQESLKAAGVPDWVLNDSTIAGIWLKRAEKNRYQAADFFQGGQGELDISPKEISDRLLSAGVKGVRYKDAGSRGSVGGTYNYVVFDDSLITILKKYGIPMTAGAGGAMMVAGQDMPPEFAAQMGGT
jgi:hypothetical protein